MSQNLRKKCSLGTHQWQKLAVYLCHTCSVWTWTARSVNIGRLASQTSLATITSKFKGKYRWYVSGISLKIFCSWLIKVIKTFNVLIQCAPAVFWACRWTVQSERGLNAQTHFLHRERWQRTKTRSRISQQWHCKWCVNCRPFVRAVVSVSGSDMGELPVTPWWQLQASCQVLLLLGLIHGRYHVSELVGFYLKHLALSRLVYRRCNKKKGHIVFVSW